MQPTMRSITPSAHLQSDEAENNLLDVGHFSTFETLILQQQSLRHLHRSHRKDSKKKSMMTEIICWRRTFSYSCRATSKASLAAFTACSFDAAWLSLPERKMGWQGAGSIYALHTVTLLMYELMHEWLPAYVYMHVQYFIYTSRKVNFTHPLTRQTMGWGRKVPGALINFFQAFVFTSRSLIECMYAFLTSCRCWIATCPVE